jgi:S1-C subfamily serine protease
MSNLYNARDFFKGAILSGFSNVSTRSIGFIAESLNKATGRHYFHQNADSLLSVSTIGGSHLRLIFDSEYICTGNECNCLKNEVARITGLHHNNIVLSHAAMSQNYVSAGDWIGNGKANEIGTLGGFVIDKNNVKPNYLITNNHVIAMSNNANIGDWVKLWDGDKWVWIGQLHRFIPIDFSGRTNRVDLAVATVTSNANIQIGGYSRQRWPRIGEQVKKVGAKTGFTYGQVLSVDETVKVRYGNQIATFEDQVLISGLQNAGAFSLPGDSGSFIFGENEDFVGLLFAGNGIVTHANPGPTVAAQLVNWNVLQ